MTIFIISKFIIRLTPIKLQTKFKNSFELNQSYPTIKQNIRSKLYDARFDDSGNSELKTTSGMDKIRGKFGNAVTMKVDFVADSLI